ncbi:hypothetical protein L6Q96_02905 [Candidatus Binatia bacterium]|nr:hypothetical protein [Candidatus Binatia bacterium]
MAPASCTPDRSWDDDFYPLGLDSWVRAQLHSDTGNCYETAFTPGPVTGNDGMQFEAKS